MTTKLSLSELLERAKTEKFAIHVLTKKQAITLLSELDKRGYTWSSGSKLTNTTYYGIYREDTCYSFCDCDRKSRDKESWYGSFYGFQREGYTIIKFSDIDFKEKTKMNQREWQAWAHIRDRALECMADYDDYPRIKDRLDEDLKIIQDLLTKGEKYERQ